MMLATITPILAVVAGMVILTSMLPDIAANYRHPMRAKGQDWRRPALQCFGYTIWVSYGVLRHDLYLASVTGTALVLSVILLMQARRAIYSKSALITQSAAIRADA